MEMVLNIFVNPNYDLTDAPFEDGVAASLEGESKRASSGESSSGVSNDERARNTEAMWRFVHEHFSLNHMHAAVNDASEDQLRQTQIDITFLYDFIRRVSTGKPEIERLKELRAFAAYSLGTLLTAVDLTLRHQGLGHLIDQGLSRLAALNINEMSKAAS